MPKDKAARGIAKFFSAFAVTLLFTAGLTILPAVSIAGQGVFRLLAARKSSVRFYDSAGVLAGAMPSPEGEWRFPIPGRIPRRMELAFTAVEDWRFRSHSGIDPAAVLRAAFQNVTSGSIVSGASTITMQLARCLDYRGRSWRSKFIETLRALALEQYLSKDMILRLYLDNLPFGGRIYGVETAAQYYFSSSAEDLNWEQLALLAGIPQRPNAFRPDKHPEAAAKRRHEVLNLFLYHGVIPPETAEDIRRRPILLNMGDFAGNAVSGELQSRHYCRLAAGEDPAPEVVTCLKSQWQAAAVKMARAWTASFANVEDCAIVAVNNRDLTVPVLLGGTDFFSPAAGMVNSATARRAPGSLLKPFIYGCAVKKGLIVPETVIMDDMINIHGYAPENFSREFTGRTTAARALAESLNIPAVMLLARVGVEDWLTELQEFGFAPWPGTAPGLSAALGGGVEISPLEAAEACAAIANGGIHGELRLTAGKAPGERKRIWSSSTAYLVNTMLRRPLPGAPKLDAAWKTGTSHGRRDAWCAVWDRDFTVVVWLGNKSGAAAAGLVGAEAAAPLAGRLLALFHNSVPAEPWQDAAEANAGLMTLCAATGLRAWAGCSEQITGLGAKDIPLQLCRECSSLSDKVTAGKLLKPAAGTVYSEKGRENRIDFLAEGQEVLWYCNGIYMTDEHEFTRVMEDGDYTVTAVFPASGTAGTVKFRIIPLEKSSRELR